MLIFLIRQIAAWSSAEISPPCGGELVVQPGTQTAKVYSRSSGIVI